MGRSTIVMTAPSVSPNMITTDIETQNIRLGLTGKRAFP